jgi:hypothetical protein
MLIQIFTRLIIGVAKKSLVMELLTVIFLSFTVAISFMIFLQVEMLLRLLY